MKTFYRINLVVLTLFSVLSISCQNNTDDESIVLSEQEINDMKFMLEEEKLAHDVYDLLDEKWGLRVFGNIKQSELRHMNSMKNLLEKNGVSYQLSSERGVFYNEELQKMYSNLVEQGIKSEHEALKVGKAIEEKDIADLKQAIEKTNYEFAKNVYKNLLQASYKHLNAFNRNLSR